MLFFGGAPIAAAQNQVSSRDTLATPLISARDGKQIAETALQQDAPVWKAQDCSHLVHQIYSAAGYEYPYASSFELYAGHGNFRRVRRAQAGDLIAWRGHVGIVVNAREHTFYSLVRSGLQTEDYLSPYWRSRGTPRFYRYVLDSSTRTASTIRVSSSASPAKPAVATIAETEKRSRTPRSEPVVDEEEPAGNIARERSEEAPLTSIDIPTERDRPTTEEVLAAIATAGERATTAFRTDEPLRVATPVIISDDVKLEKLELKRDKGWAHLKISSHVRITSDGADFKQRPEKMKWELRRGESGWSVTLPLDYKLVPRDSAVRVLAAQLAELAQSDGAAQHDEAVLGEEARIANVIAALLSK